MRTMLTYWQLAETVADVAAMAGTVVFILSRFCSFKLPQAYRKIGPV